MTISQLESLALTSGRNGQHTQDLPQLEGIERNRDNRKIWKSAWRQGNLERKSANVAEREAWYNEVEERQQYLADSQREYHESGLAFEMAMLHGPEEVYG